MREKRQEGIEANMLNRWVGFDSFVLHSIPIYDMTFLTAMRMKCLPVNSRLDVRCQQLLRFVSEHLCVS